MPVFNFDLEDGQPPVSFTLKPQDAARFVNFMRECDESSTDAKRYRSIRAALLSGGPEWSKLAAMLNIAPDTSAGVDDAVDAAFPASSPASATEEPIAT